jgi:hypothetical protein
MTDHQLLLLTFLATLLVIIATLLPWLVDRRGKRLTAELIAYQRESDYFYFRALRTFSALQMGQENKFEPDGLTFFVTCKVSGMLARARGRYGVIFPSRTPERTVLKLLIAARGSEAVRRDDFDAPIRITVATGAVKKAFLAKTSHEDLKPRVARHGNVITVSPLLLNPGDWFVLGLDCAGLESRSWFGDIVTIRTRFVGSSRVRVSKRAGRIWGLAVLVPMLLYASGVGYVLHRLPDRHSGWSIVITVGLVIVLLLCLFASTRLIKRVRALRPLEPGDMRPSHLAPNLWRDLGRLAEARRSKLYEMWGESPEMLEDAIAPGRSTTDSLKRR